MPILSNVPDFPLVNGNLYSWVSITSTIAGLPMRGIKEIGYKNPLEVGDVYGYGPRKLGRVRGQYKPEASITFYKQYHSALVAAMGDGFLEYNFDIVVNWREVYGSPIVTDSIFGCRFKSVDNSHSEGTDASIVKCELNVIEIWENGTRPLLPDPANP